MNSAAFSFEMRETKRAYADFKETPPNKHATDGGTIAAGTSQEGEERVEHCGNSNSFCPRPSNCRNNQVEANGAATPFTSCAAGFLGPLPFVH